MPWVKLTDDFYEDDKIISAGPVGLAMWITGIAWSSRNLTDGRIPRAKVRGLIDWDGIAWHMWMGDIVGGGDDVDALDVAAELVRAGLWEEADDGFLIVNYLKYQPSAESVKAKRKSERERWVARRGSKDTPRGVGEESAGSCDVPVPVPGSRYPNDSFFPVPDALWQVVAGRLMAKRVADHEAGKTQEGIGDAAKWRAKAERNARSELGLKASGMLERYEFASLEQFADALLASSAPSWLNGIRRPVNA